MPVFTFSCEAGHETERLVRDRETSEILCPACSEPAFRRTVYLVAVNGFARAPVNEREIKIGAFQEAGAELEYQHSRQTNVDGSEAPTAPLWQMAKKKAKRLESLGVKDSLDMR